MAARTIAKKPADDIITEQIRAALRAVATPERAEGGARYFKTGKGQYGEGDKFLGVTVPAQRESARRFRHATLDDAVTLLQSPWHEERLTALLLMVERYKKGDSAEKQRVFDAYLANLDRVNNWDLVDSSAAQIVGLHLEERPRDLLYELARSPKLFRRRVAMLSTFAFIRTKDFDDALALAEGFLTDAHDLMHKAVGWMLREIGERDMPRLRAFLDEHAAVMPRTMLRYAIEKMPETTRKRYLSAKG